MSIDSGIDRDKWLAALEEAGTRDVPEQPGVYTVAELATMTGCGLTTMYARLRRLVADGKAEQTIKRIRRTGGAPVTVTAYRLLD